MGWRDIHKVHPAADVFPMMSDEELAKLADDIKAGGLKVPITVDKDGVLLDGRNRLEAMEHAGIELKSVRKQVYLSSDPVGYIISANVHRRHLSKQQQADLIVAAYNAVADEAKPPQDEAVSKGGRGKVNPIKQAATANAKKHGISKSTVERSLAKAGGKKPASTYKRRTEAEMERDRLRGGVQGIMRGIGDWAFSDAALDLLTKDELHDFIEDAEKAIASLDKLLGRLRARLEHEAA